MFDVLLTLHFAIMVYHSFFPTFFVASLGGYVTRERILN